MKSQKNRQLKYKYPMSYDEMMRRTTESLDAISPDKNQAHFDNLVQFIGSVAKNEQQKEIESIKNYCAEMKKVFHEGLDDEWNINEILNEDYIKNNPIEFQKRFIIAFDGARRGIEHTIQQINQTKTELDDSSKMNELTHSNYLYKLHGDLKSLIKQLIGQKTQEQINNTTVTSNLNRQVSAILSASGAIDAVTSGKDFVAIGSAILVDVEQKVQDFLNSHTEYSKFEQIPAEAFDTIGKNYIEELRTNSPTSRIQQILLNGFKNNPELDQAIENAGKILRIKEAPMSEKQCNEFLQQAEQLEIEEENEVKNVCQNFQNKVKLNKELYSSLYNIDFNISSSSKGEHGNIYEFAQSVILGGGKVRTNVATDLVTYHIDCNITPNDSAITNYIDSTTETLSSIQDELMKSKNKHKISNLVNIIKQANKDLKKLTKDLEKQLQNIKGLEKQKLFIQQETLKLHSSAGKNQGFEGRTMVITSYISYLASMNGVNDNLSINQRALEFLSYNLLPGGTLNNEALEGKEKLENYFSYFSAMLMFDDVRNMAEEAAKQVASQSQVQTLHVYNLNGTYVPSSVILTEMYNNLLSQASLFKSSSQAARARIEFKNKPPKSISDIQVKITLLSGYENLIKQLTEQM